MCRTGTAVRPRAPRADDPGVGPRLAETVVATLDDLHRFRRRREVAAYAGLVPCQFESGTMSRQGRIAGAGQKLPRALLVEVG